MKALQFMVQSVHQKVLMNDFPYRKQELLVGFHCFSLIPTTFYMLFTLRLFSPSERFIPVPGCDPPHFHLGIRNKSYYGNHQTTHQDCGDVLKVIFKWWRSVEDFRRMSYWLYWTCVMHEQLKEIELIRIIQSFIEDYELLMSYQCWMELILNKTHAWEIHLRVPLQDHWTGSWRSNCNWVR